VSHFNSPREIYFIDAGLTDIAVLTAELPQGAEVHLLSRQADGLDQMLAAVCERTGFTAIHILSHAEPARLALGDGWLTREGLETRADDLARLGQALAAGGDLLLYGCELAKGDAGQDFVARMAQLTGADVAASRSLTGAADLGGDWELAVRHGQIEARALQIQAYPGVLVAPTVGGLTGLTLTEGDAAVTVAENITLTGGSGYAGGSITFSVGSAMAGDQLRLTSGAAANDAGAISLDGGIVYLGNGSGRDQIGTIDATNNGVDGKPLTINFTGVDTGVLSNPSFESGVTGWTVVTDRVILGTTVINGIVTPTDTTIALNSGGDGDPATMSYFSELSTTDKTAGDQALRLYNTGSTQNGYGVVHGPYAYSETFDAKAGDVFNFDWRALAGGDAYDAFGYLMNVDTSTAQVVIDVTGTDAGGQTPWATASVTVPTDGNYFFTFVAGTYDFSGGKAVGGSLFIDNFRVERSVVSDAIIKTVAAQVTYQNTSDAPPAGSRTLSIVVKDGAGARGEVDTTVAVTGVNDAPTGSLKITGTPEEGKTLAIDDQLSDPDGMGSVTYQWQVDGVDIDGATGSTLVVDPGYVGKTVSVVASFIDGGGTAESVTATRAIPTPPPPPPVVIVDGAPVQTWTGVAPDGTPTQTMTVPFVTNNRPDSVGAGATADIALYTPPSGQPLLTAQLPVGFGLQVTGPTTPKTAGTSLTDLIREIRAHTLVGSTDQNVLTGGGSGFLTGLAEDTPLLVQTIVPEFATGSGVPTSPLVISGRPTEPGEPMTALVIDARHLPSGTPLELHNVEFAAVIGAMRVTGGEGRQIVWGDGASQYIVLGADDDILRGGAGADTVGSAAGDDQLFGDEGDDVVFGGEGDDFLHGNAGADTVNGGEGHDIVHGGKGDDRLFGDAGNDVVLGDLDNDFIHGNAGADTLSGGDGSDTVHGGRDGDVVFGDGGDDVLFGDQGDDFLQGNAGSDTLEGGDGSDLLHGGKGDDVLAGGAGADTLSGDFGDDVLAGGAGADVFMTFAGGGADRVLDFNFAEGDRVRIEQGSAYTVVQQGADTVIDMGAGSRLTLEGVQLSTLGEGWILG